MKPNDDFEQSKNAHRNENKNKNKRKFNTNLSSHINLIFRLGKSSCYSQLSQAPVLLYRLHVAYLFCSDPWLFPFSSFCFLKFLRSFIRTILLRPCLPLFRVCRCCCHRVFTFLPLLQNQWELRFENWKTIQTNNTICRFYHLALYTMHSAHNSQYTLPWLVHCFKRVCFTNTKKKEEKWKKKNCKTKEFLFSNKCFTVIHRHSVRIYCHGTNAIAHKMQELPAPTTNINKSSWNRTFWF